MREPLMRAIVLWLPTEIVQTAADRAIMTTRQDLDHIWRTASRGFDIPRHLKDLSTLLRMMKFKLDLGLFDCLNKILLLQDIANGHAPILGVYIMHRSVQSVVKCVRSDLQNSSKTFERPTAG